MHRTRDGARVSSCPLSGLAHICTGIGPSPATSAPGLGPLLPHLHRDWARRCHICAGIGLISCQICAGTGPIPATSAPGLGSPLPHLRRDWAHLLPHLRRDWAHLLPHLRRDSAGPDLLFMSTSRMLTTTCSATPSSPLGGARISCALFEALKPAGSCSTRSIGPRGVLEGYPTVSGHICAGTCLLCAQAVQQGKVLLHQRVVGVHLGSARV